MNSYSSMGERWCAVPHGDLVVVEGLRFAREAQFGQLPLPRINMHVINPRLMSRTVSMRW